MTPKYERKVREAVLQLTDSATFERTRKGRIKVTIQGVRPAVVIFGCPSSADHRSFRNTLADMRRAMANCGAPIRGIAV